MRTSNKIQSDEEDTEEDNLVPISDTPQELLVSNLPSSETSHSLKFPFEKTQRKSGDLSSTNDMIRYDFERVNQDSILK